MPTITRKYQLKVVGDKEETDRVYTYLRNGIEAQNKALNEAISALYAAKILEMSTDDNKELTKLFRRVTHGKNETGFTDDITFPVGLPTAGDVGRKAKQDLDNAFKKGLRYGRVSLPSYKADSPLMIHVDYVRLRSTNPHKDNGIYHEYETPMDLIEALEKENNPKVFLKFVNGIVFRFVFGNPWKGREQRKVFEKIFSEEYKVCGSSIEVDGKKIILNLCMDVPKAEHKLDKNVAVGVDLGLAIPAVCALNNNEYERLFIGNIDDFLRVRTQLQSQRRRLQKNMRNGSGGHGRSKKLKAMDRLRDRERNFVQTYNHMVSRRVVDFAVKNNAAYINIEDLSGFGKDSNGDIHKDKEIVLRNWSYYELQNYITYKAQMHGIEVRKVKPEYTSQICSYCGKRGIRREQAKFVCINPECRSHKIYGKGFVNADFNAARNIAMSANFVEDTETKQTRKGA